MTYLNVLVKLANILDKKVYLCISIILFRKIHTYGILDPSMGISFLSSNSDYI